MSDNKKDTGFINIPLEELFIKENRKILEPETVFTQAEGHEQVTYPCPYFHDGRETTLDVIRPSLEQLLHFHDLLPLGFRRSGGVFYMNKCSTCQECISIRVELAQFKPSKSQRRTLRLNKDIEVVVRHFSERGEAEPQEKFDLFRKYMLGKHDNHESAEYQEFYSLHHGYPFTSELYYYTGRRLVAVSIIDEARDALSSNYFYYDPDLLDRRLGIFSIMKEIEYAQARGKTFYYLGFYIENCQKMSYKKYIRPNQILDEKIWKPFIAEP